MDSILVFDWGGTFLKFALIASNGKISEKDKVSTPHFPEATKADFLGVIDSIVQKYAGKISGIAISAPGIFDDLGNMKTAGALVYLVNSSICKEFEVRYKFPISIQNDGKCAALAELKAGSLRGCKNAAVMILGTGVGGGLIINGELYKGTHGSAGEYSFLCTHPTQPIEESTFFATTGSANYLSTLVSHRTGEFEKDLDGEKIFVRVQNGEEPICKALSAYTDLLASQIFNINMLLDLEKIAIGGGISASPLLLESLKKSFDNFVTHNPFRFFNPAIPIPELTTCTFKSDANLLGAWYHFCAQHS